MKMKEELFGFLNIQCQRVEKAFSQRQSLLSLCHDNNVTLKNTQHINRQKKRAYTDIHNHTHTGDYICTNLLTVTHTQLLAHY